MSAPTKEEINAIGAAIQSSKVELQRTFATGNVEAIQAKIEEVKEAIKRLPEPFATVETVQTLLNLSTAFLHTGKLQEAVNYNEEGVRHAEGLVKLQPTRPEPLDLLSGALGAKVNISLAAGKFDVAEECAERAYAIAEKLFQKNDVRMTKSLRNLGFVQCRKGNYAEGEQNLVRAYTIVCLASGAQSPEAQMLTDDLVKVFATKDDLETAEKYARANYKKVSEMSLKDPKEIQILGDSASRLGSLLVNRGNFEEAETLVAQALSIRETNQSENFNPLGVAYSLAQLAGIHEELGKITAKTEEMLIRASDIFASAKGQQSTEVANTLNQLRSIRMKRANNKKEGDVDGTNSPTAQSGTGNGITSSPHFTADPFALSELDQKKISSLPKDDGDSRLVLAQVYFQTNKFLAASILLSEAHELFLSKEGPAGEKTKMAKQNLMVSQMKRIDQLWMSAAHDELRNLEDQASETATPAVAEDGFASDDDSDVVQPVKKSALSKLKQKSGGDNNKKLTTEEELFLRSLDSSPRQSANSCVIC